MNDAIGGYFELELPQPKLMLYPGARGFQSARTAFLALLRAGRPTRVWMPRYICDAMLGPFAQLGINYDFYHIDENFNIVDSVDMRPDDWLLYVNYFGICSENVNKILERFDPARIILDYSQAFFSAPRECLATIYSPRKFFGVPDGGLLVTDMPVELPAEIDVGSVGRMTHLTKRLAGSPESGYGDYKIAERSLDDLKPRGMSCLTQKILTSINYKRARIKRNKNFNFLHKTIGKFNRIRLASLQINGPLCYPFITKKSGLRNYLISKRVFIPTYWPEVENRVSEGDFEFDLLNSCIAVPCDQRYEISDMRKICQMINKEEV